MISYTETRDINPMEDFPAQFEDIHERIMRYTEFAEEIITTALNVEESNKLLDQEIESMKKLVDELKKYDKKVEQLLDSFSELRAHTW